MNTITQQLRTLQTQPAAELAERYAELFGKPPRNHNRAWLLRQCAWKLQERELGGLSDRARTRLDALCARIDLPLPEARATRGLAPRATPARPSGHQPSPGTTLTRRWRDTDIRVQVLDDGFEWNGVRYASLSAVAKAITGASWNGRLFFGLVERRPAS
jgi:hypothetical protein